MHVMTHLRPVELSGDKNEYAMYSRVPLLRVHHSIKKEFFFGPQANLKPKPSHYCRANR